MALSAVRVGDMCSGHAFAEPRPAMTGSPDVLINTIAAVRVNDMWGIHGVIPHTGVSVGGAMTVLCNGLPLVRTTDPISCGSQAVQGSLDVFVGA